jgi:predicted nucleotide-binding protein
MDNNKLTCFRSIKPKRCGCLDEREIRELDFHRWTKIENFLKKLHDDEYSIDQKANEIRYGNGSLAQELVKILDKYEESKKYSAVEEPDPNLTVEAYKGITAARSYGVINQKTGSTNNLEDNDNSKQRHQPYKDKARENNEDRQSSNTYRSYHVMIKIKSGSKEITHESRDLNEINLKRGITIPYSQGKDFFFDGTIINPSQIIGIRIIATRTSTKGCTPTPNFENLLTEGEDVTVNFITTPPQVVARNSLEETKTITESNKVFIVHGHDSHSKNELSTFLFQLGLQPIILHDQPNEGRTILQKFKDHSSDVRYAFVLLTPDDTGKDETEEDYKLRARQNVILELGFFIGKLGENRVCGLCKGEIEIPSDLLGILFLKFKESIQERKFEIVQELEAAGYNIKRNNYG